MTEYSTDENGDIFDVSPYLKLVIDKDGRWFQNGAEIIHPEIYRMFAGMLEKTADGNYIVRFGGEICRVEVEDAPFVIQSVDDAADGRIIILLNDGSREPLDPDHFWIGKENVPYCKVKEGAFHARFSRPAYYQLARHIVAGDDKNAFFLLIDGKRTEIKERQEVM
jgi:uncharacterized protein